MPWAPRPRAASSRLPATSSSSARPWCAPRGGARSTASVFGARPSTFSPSRSWPPAPPRNGRKTDSTTSAAGRRPMASWTAPTSTPWSTCWRKASPRVAGAPARGSIATTSGASTPDTANYDVILEPDETLIGSVDEDFAVESLAGDVILLGNNSWRIRRVEGGRVRVEDAGGAAPSIPFWLGEGPARTRELSVEVAAVREEVEKRLGDPPAAARWLLEGGGVGGRGGGLA